MGRKDKNKIVTNVTIEAMAAEGKSFGKIEDKITFVSYAAPGDIVDLRIIKSKKSFNEARIENYVKKSPDRIEPACSHFETCGGCKWQHISYPKQLEFKQQQVQDNIERIGKVAHTGIAPIVGSKLDYAYRNKIEFTFTEQRWLTTEEINSGADIDRRGVGFHVPGGFAYVIDLEQCYLTGELQNRIRMAVREYAIKHEIPFINLRSQEGVLRNLVIRNTDHGEMMVILIFKAEDERNQALLQYVADTFPEITSLLYILNEKMNDTYSDLTAVAFKGNPYLMERMDYPDKEGYLQFKVGPTSFYQTNNTQAFELYKKTFELAELTGEEIVYDLYTGAGTIANFVAHKAKKVVGIEYIEPAIADAKVNSEINGITNTSFFAGDMKDVLSNAFIKKHGKPDIIITDPPRAGMHEDVINVILNAAPKRIVYVSCNPATQARDLQLLDEKYKITGIQPVDMFPQTAHVENIVRLDLR